MFFVFMVLHLWGQYFMASWREGRAPTWMVGAVTFGVSIVAAFAVLVALGFEVFLWLRERRKVAVPFVAAKAQRALA